MSNEVIEEVQSAEPAAPTISENVAGSPEEAVIASIPLPEELKNPLPLPEEKKVVPEDRIKAREQVQALLLESYAEGHRIDSNNKVAPSPHHNVKIYETHVEIQIGGISKNVSITFYAELIQSLMNVENSMKVNYELPFGTYLMGINGDSMEISCYYPETIDQINFYEGGMHKFTVPIPNTVIHHKLKKIKEFWVVQASYYYATNRRVNQLPNEHLNNLGRGNNPTNGVWTFPFGNMYDGGTMCYGGNQIPTQHGANLRGLDYFYRLITLSSFNRDLGLRYWSGSHMAFYQMLSEKKEFPYEIFR